MKQNKGVSFKNKTDEKALIGDYIDISI